MLFSRFPRARVCGGVHEMPYYYDALSPPVQKFVGVLVYILCGFLEIGGGYLVWQYIRASKPWYWALGGSALLVGYGFAATLQPLADFARAYAIYGGVFILMSLLWGVAFDGFKPDVGDISGSVVVGVGICLIYFWPR